MLPSCSGNLINAGEAGGGGGNTGPALTPPGEDTTMSGSRPNASSSSPMHGRISPEGHPWPPWALPQFEAALPSRRAGATLLESVIVARKDDHRPRWLCRRLVSHRPRELSYGLGRSGRWRRLRRSLLGGVVFGDSALRSPARIFAALVCLNGGGVGGS